MRAYCEIVGLGERKKGVSTKTGKPYDFQPVSMTFPDKFTTGVKAATANVSGSDIDACGGLKIGETYDMVYHTFNGSVVVDAIL